MGRGGGVQKRLHVSFIRTVRASPTPWHMATTCSHGFCMPVQYPTAGRERMDDMITSDHCPTRTLTFTPINFQQVDDKERRCAYRYR